MVGKSDKGRKDSLRLQKLLAAPAKPTATEAGEVNALVIGIGPGLAVSISKAPFVTSAVRSLWCRATKFLS
jgi:hypothetical protein